MAEKRRTPDVKPHPGIRAIIFDADGMVVNGAIFSDQLARDYNIVFDQTKPFFTGVFQECLVGKANLREVLPQFLQQWGWQGSIDDFLTYWFTSEHHIDERIVEKIKALQQKGIKCFLATNQEGNRAHYLDTEMGFGTVFDKTYSSATAGSKKPQQEFFDHIQNELEAEGITKDQVEFWDDKEVNVKAAQDYGWHARLYKEYSDFEQSADSKLQH